MRTKGISYDTGFWIDGRIERPFAPELVRHELDTIRDALHCNAVRLIGNDLDRLDFAGAYAAERGLEVWYSPYPMDLDQDAVLAQLIDAAQRAEALRQRSRADVVLVAGAELSLFNAGYLTGATLTDRMASLSTPEGRARLAGVPAAINAFFARAIPAVREQFLGQVTYASIPFENLDWDRFDIIGVDLHRSKQVAEHFPLAVLGLARKPKPVAITEVGCTTHRGASDHAAMGNQILEYDGGKPVRVKGDPVRDEGEQARYLTELLRLFDMAGIDATFVTTFVMYGYPHRDDPRHDFDMASWGVVKELENPQRWEPKEAFHTLAGIYEG
jgi:hypothetical protein